MTATATRAGLLALAERAERAEGPDSELDADIALTQGWHEYPGDNWIGPHAQICVPAFTASLDAAMTLVPKEWRPSVGQNVHHRHWAAYMQRIAIDSYIEMVGIASAATPALALTAAALRARAESAA